MFLFGLHCAICCLLKRLCSSDISGIKFVAARNEKGPLCWVISVRPTMPDHWIHFLLISLNIFPVVWWNECTLLQCTFALQTYMIWWHQQTKTRGFVKCMNDKWKQWLGEERSVLLLGATSAESSAEIASKNKVIVTMLPSSPNVIAAYTGKDGILRFIQSSSLHWTIVISSWHCQSFEPNPFLPNPHITEIWLWRFYILYLKYL